MAYSESLADRIRRAFGRRRGIEERKMFGGLVFLLNGNMCIGVWEYALVARIGPEQGEEPQVKEFVITGRPIKGWVRVEPEAIESDEHLIAFVQRAVTFVETLKACRRNKGTGRRP